MPRKSTSKASATPKAASAQETPSRRSGLRTPAAKQPAKEPATPASEPKRSRRSSTAAQTAASQADSKKTRSHDDKSGDEGNDRSSPSSRSTRRPMKKVNYEESDGEEDNADKPVGREDDYNAEEEDVENDSDSLESTSKKKGKLKAPSTPPKSRNSRSRSQNSRSSKPSRSHKKKVPEETDDKDADEDKVDAAEEEEEKPKGGTRSRRAAAAASPATSPPARPTRAARQRKSTGSEDKPETAKPVRSSTRTRKTKVEQQEDENEEMEEEADEKPDESEINETKSDNKESKKRKLDLEEGDEEGGNSKKAKVDDIETSNDLAHAEDDSKKAVDTEEKEEQDEDPMDVDQAENAETHTSDEKTEPVVKPDEVSENEESEPSEKKEGNEAEDAIENTESTAEAKPESGDTKEEAQGEEEEELEEEGDEEDDEEEEEEEDEEEKVEKEVEDAEAKETDIPKTSEEIVNQNSPVQLQSPTKQNSSLSTVSVDASEQELDSEEPEKPVPMVSDSPKATKCESFQSSPAKNQETVNGTSADDMPTANTKKSEPTQMLPSSAIELTQQHTKPEPEVIRISANGHVTDDKSSLDAPTNDCSSGLLHGRVYFANRSPCAEALSRHKERTFGLVSFNLESTKVDEKFCLELKSVVSDIVCMQGISQELFSEQLEPCLNALGYKGTFAQDESLAVATFYRSSLFQLKGQKKLTLKQAIVKELEHSMSPGEVSVVAEKIPPCGQVLFTHLGLVQGTRAVIIANVLVPTSDVSIQALQMSCLVQEAVAFLECGGTSTGVPLVFCGAFNMEQQEAAYQLLRDGYLSNDMIEALQSKKELRLPGRDEDTSLVNLLWKSFQHSTSGLKSCYSAVTGQELVVNSQESARTSPDLIWFTSDSLTPIGVLQPPSTPTGHHLLLKANLAFNY